jgi:hypothetical protein
MLRLARAARLLHLARHLTHHLAPHLRLLRWLDTEFLVDLRPVLEAVRG